MTRQVRNRARILLVLGCVALLYGCPVRLAPDYSPGVVEGLSGAGSNLMELFASISTGTTPDTFGQREDTYNALIGWFETLALEVRTRPQPEGDVLRKVNEYLESRDVPRLDDGQSPSAIAIQEVADTITKMRDTDRKQGLTALEVRAFKGQALIFLDQALTYEKFLER